MPPRESIPGTPQQWLRRAKSSLALARIDKPQEALWEDLCYHAQQAAEKALKAVLLDKGIGFRYVHDLQELITTLKRAAVEVPESVEQAAELTEYAVEARYPGGNEPVTEPEYRKAVKCAEAVLSWAESILQA